MRLSNIEDADKFLKDTFIDDYNKRFSHTKGLPDIHLGIDGENLDNIFCMKQKDKLGMIIQ